MAGAGPLSLSQPTRQRLREFDALSWNYEAIGEATYDGVSAFGDSVGTKQATGSSEKREVLRPGEARYVFDGTGTLAAGGKVYQLKPNTIIEVGDQGCDAVWTRGKECASLVLGTPEYDSPARAVARAAVPYVFGGLLVLGGVAVVAGGL